MEHLFLWQNLLFYIPMIGGALIGVGLLLGGVDGHGGHHGAHPDAAHHDAHAGHSTPDTAHAAPHAAAHDTAHSHPGRGVVPGKAWAALGFGQLPLSLAIMLLSLLFGGIGVVMNTTLRPLLGTPGLYVWLSLAAALFGSVFITRLVGRLLGRVAPTFETYSVSRRDLIGCSATLISDADDQVGYALVRDREGNPHNITVRTYRGGLPKGEVVLIVDYDEERKGYLIEPSPVRGDDPPRPQRVAVKQE